MGVLVVEFQCTWWPLDDWRVKCSRSIAPICVALVHRLIQLRRCELSFPSVPWRQIANVKVLVGISPFDHLQEVNQ